MNSKKNVIAPISVDLGAQHTGVYSAFYDAGTSPEDIEREGVVYNLNSNSFTLMMKDRTAKRHQRRGYNRRQMAKRLFKLIWEHELGLEWNQQTSQAIGFLFNRRGFSYLQEEYDENRLGEFSQDAWGNLPQNFKDMLEDVPYDGEFYDLGNTIQKLAQEERGKEALAHLCVEQKVISRNIFYYERSIKIKEYCQALTEGKENIKVDKDIKFISRWIIDQWQKEGVAGLNDCPENRFDMAGFLKDHPENAQPILDTMPDYSEEKETAEKSIWNFDETKINVETMDSAEGKSKNLIETQTKNHLHNLAYALYIVDKELRSGAKHRKKYIEEILEILEKTDHTHKYLSNFVQKMQAGNFAGKTPRQFTNLIGHISNLELRPIRRYFDNKNHSGGDYWDAEELKKSFEDWILKQWRVNLNNNPEKGDGQIQDYKALCRRWKEHNGGVVEFWINEDPISTIPPYQNNNNRRPPRCQSLILNAQFLENQYPDWKKWLNTMKELSQDYLKDFEASLESIKTSKGKNYFTGAFSGTPVKDSQKQSYADKDARILQFLFDRSKAADPFKLNEIYSYTKKIRQSREQAEQAENWNDKLLEAIKDSSLPEELKTRPEFNDDAIFAPRSFLHLVCRYYKLRQRARDGRLFIHPKYKKNGHRGYEKTNRFGDDTLLRYCNLKPRQKKYQSFMDIASVFQVSEKLLEKTIGSTDDNELINWLKGFRGLQDLCKKSAKAQKNYRGQLAHHLAIGKDKDLIKLKKKAEKISNDIGNTLFGPEETTMKKNRVAKFQSVFSFAQIYNIAFKERTGNSNTCPICSMDNGKRMDATLIPSTETQVAKAQRLPSLSTRLIDGAVMRMMRILSKQIAQDRWPAISKALEEDHKVRIPIITESNSFKFETSLKALKPTSRSKKNDAKEPTFDEKKARIKQSGKNICPYTGRSVKEAGEIDHIIPRSSRWGTLNDETNLIFATRHGNEQKGEKHYSFANLHSNYKEAVFATSDDEQIEDIIAKEIWDEQTKTLTIGKYTSFINLNENQQRAFRHALFSTNTKLKNAVISEINNKTRTLVNGTQRYFAEVLANEFYKKALSVKREHLLEFDYFSVEAYTNSRGDGIEDWRGFYELIYHEKLKDFAKRKGAKQESYSHLLDATIAFLITADKHRNAGSLCLNIPDEKGLLPLAKETGELSQDNLLTDIWVSPDQMKDPINLKRRKPLDGFTKHRSFTRDGIYADRYLPILIKKTNRVKVKAGFDWNNSGHWTMNKRARDTFVKLLPLFNERKHYPKTSDIELKSEDDIYSWLVSQPFFEQQVKNNGRIILTIDRVVLHELWIKNHNTLDGDTGDDLFKFCYKKIGYRTEKKEILLPSKDTKDDIATIVKNEDKYFSLKFNDEKIILPCKKLWDDCLEKCLEWQKSHDEEDDFLEFLKGYFIKQNTSQPHQRARKKFSLPVKSNGGKYLLKRKSWEGKFIYQIVDDSDSRSGHNKATYPVLTENGDVGEQLNSWTKSKNFVKLSLDYTTGEPIDPNRWFLVDKEIFPLPEGCQKVELRLPDKSRPDIRITLDRDGEEFDPAILETNSFIRPRINKPKDEALEEFWKTKICELKEGEYFEFKGDDLTAKHKEAILHILSQEKQQAIK